MLTIYTGNIYSDRLASLDTTYAWPEEEVIKIVKHFLGSYGKKG